ncbi:MAG: hypothetical protein ACP8RL_05670 [cyanobacterium endosymbiont of Rhopalodia inflata]
MKKLFWDNKYPMIKNNLCCCTKHNLNATIIDLELRKLDDIEFVIFYKMALEG